MGVVFADQASKYLALRHLSSLDPIQVIPPVLDLVLVKNRGAAFGIMSGLNLPVRMIVFSIVSLGALALLIYLFRSRSAGSFTIPAAVGLVSGGAVGNWIDRIRFGYVVDFIDWHVGSYHWPTFNIADSCITIGVGLLLLNMILEDRKHHAS
ncbi:signal peptidase II [bacterium]|nr:signal peptidase II [candidate division CSSED10-310 bacterium]